MTVTDPLAEALAELQTQLPEIRKASKAQYGSYANLTDVSLELLPVLGKLGFSFTCVPTLLDDGRFVLDYFLRHISGDGIGGQYPLPAQGSPQQIGSAITYGRRYCLCAVTGAVAEEDDDGQAASQPAPQRKRESPPRRPAAELPRNNDGSVSRSRTTDAELAATGQMTDAQIRDHGRLERATKGTGPQGTQRLTATPNDDPWYDPPPVPLPAARAAQPVDRRIVMHFDRFGITDRDVRLGYTALLAGRDRLTSTKELTAAEGLAVEKALAKCKDRDAFAQLVGMVPLLDGDVDA